VQVRNLVASPDTVHPLVAYLLDEGGSERYRVFTWRPGSQPIPLTNIPQRLRLCCLNSSGSLMWILKGWRWIGPAICLW
jgi:hypothetical protein